MNPAPNRTNLEVDPDRYVRYSEKNSTGIYVRAVLRGTAGDQFMTSDIWCLTKPSLIAWLREKSKRNEYWQEEIIAAILGHSRDLIPHEDVP